MKVHEQSIKGNTTENLTGAVELARWSTNQKRREAQEAEQKVEELERTLMEIQLVAQQEEAAEREGQTTKEQIDRVAEAA